MKKVKKTKKRKNLIVVLIVFIFLAWAAITVVNQEMKIYELKQEAVVYSEKLESLKVAIDKLKIEIETSQSPAFIEKMAREKLHMVMPGEVQYNINEEKKK